MDRPRGRRMRGRCSELERGMEAALAEELLAGRYRLTERIGAGGMAEVFRAEDTVLDRPVAVKMLHPGLEHADVARRRLQSEVRLLARLSHPGLVSVFDAGNEAGRAFLVMQLVEGRTLAQRLAEGPLDIDEAARVTAELAGVLRHLHAHRLVHRDVKPSNVLLPRSGQVMLTDFGIARALDAANLTGTNTTVGTAAYMAPEQVRGEVVGAAADVYALALVLSECVSGTRSFEGQNPFAVAAARLHRAPTVPPQVATRWPGLVEAMTAEDPGRRPTAAQVTAALAAATSAVTGPQRADRTAVLQVPVDPVKHSVLFRARQRARAFWEQRPTAPGLELVRSRASRAGLAVSGRARAGRARITEAIEPRHYGPLAFVAAVALSLAVSALLAAGGGSGSAPTTPADTTTPTAATTPAPGADRLPTDLDRLEQAVRR